MSGNVTARDRVWAAIYDQHGRFRMRDVKRMIDREDRPSDETIRRVLRSAADLGVLKHYPNSPYYEMNDRRPRL